MNIIFLFIIKLYVFFNKYLKNWWKEMLIKKQRSQENTVFGVYIKDGLYSLAQSRKNHWMEFFNIFNDKDEWDGVDLNKVNILFTYSVAAHT